MLCGRGHSDPFHEDMSSWPDVAFFLAGVLGTSGFALPAVLTSAGVIVWQTLAMAIAGGVVMVAAVVVMVKFVLGGSSGNELDNF